MATEIKQRMYALFAVLGIAVFFWFSFHQNGQSLSFFARDFVQTDAIAPEIWQAVNPFFVIVLTPVIMWIFGLFTVSLYRIFGGMSRGWVKKVKEI
jgi:POT family proton-dependent oligopeptide transporter